MKFRCLFFHDWKLVRYSNYWDTSYGDRLQSYCLTYICNRCKKVKETLEYGGPHLTDEDFEGMK